MENKLQDLRFSRIFTCHNMFYRVLSYPIYAHVDHRRAFLEHVLVLQTCQTCLGNQLQSTFLDLEEVLGQGSPDLLEWCLVRAGRLLLRDNQIAFRSEALFCGNKRKYITCVQ